MSEKKVLVIAYYWPPSGGSGVQRWLKFVKYLPQFGCKPYVFTPKNPAFAVRDNSLLTDVPTEAEVIHFPIWEPYEAFFKISRIFGKSDGVAKPTDLVSGKQKTIFQRVSTWIRGNFFIPDPRIFWVRPSVKFLSNFIIEQGINSIITTGPPHSIHLIGYHLKRKNNALQWFADFRDPWTEWGLLDSLMVGSIARSIHKRLESKVLALADQVITITPFYVKRFERLGNRKVKLLTNGFDEDDFKSIQYCKSKKFTVRHVGIVNEKCDPRPFMEAVKKLAEENAIFKSNVIIEFIGEVHPQFKQYVNSSPDFNSITIFKGNIPHKELLSTYGASSLLILILHGYKDAEGFMPGKLFEYLATGLPILGVGPVSGDAANLLSETKAGTMLAGTDVVAIKNALGFYFHSWRTAPQSLVKSTKSERYSRRSVAEELAKMLI